MCLTWGDKVLAIGFGLYFLGLSFLGGIALERIRFESERTHVIERYELLVRCWQASLLGRRDEVGLGSRWASGSGFAPEPSILRKGFGQAQEGSDPVCLR